MMVLALVFTGGADAVTEYHTRFDATEGALYVQACFDAGGSIRLRAEDRNAEDFLTFVRVNDRRAMHRVSRRGIRLAASDSRRCVRYGIDLEKLTEGRNLSRGFHVGNTYAAWSGAWLWRPESLAGVRLTISHGDREHVSAPWSPAGTGPGRSVFVLDGTPADWGNLIVFGSFEPFHLEAEAGTLRVALVHGEERSVPRDLVEPWLKATVDAIGGIYGQMPLDAPQVVVAPISRDGGGPVPWGQVKRGGGSAVLLFINPDLPLEEFLEDWTASHEFSHLLHPFFGSEGRWLGEGLASYYQNIARARTGVLTARQAFGKLHAGFGRGQKDTAGMTLRQANDRMHDEGKYMRVYWSGAAYALLADVALRTAGLGSLDAALARFRACHLPVDDYWAVPDFLAELDRLMDTDVFMPLYRQWIERRQFPDVSTAYAALGLRVDDGRLRYGSDAAGRQLREALMGNTEDFIAACPDAPASDSALQGS